jgi:YbbR domain-containing protein
VPSPLRFLTGNWQLKLLALALAVLLWVVVSAEQVTSEWIPVPLQIVENDPNFELVSGEITEEVNVRFTGSGRDLMELAIRKPPLVLSIDRVQGSSQDFRLEPTMVQVPTQLAVNAQEVRAPLIRLSFRQLASRTVRVHPTVAEEVATGWTLVDTLRVEPDQVEIRGPADLVEAVEQVRTVPFSLPATDSAFTTQVAVDTSNLAGIELSASRVQVRGRVDRVVQRRLADVEISVGPGVTVRPSVVDVLLSGPRSIVERIQPAAFRVVVAIPEIPEFIPLEGLSVPLRVEELRAGVSGSVIPPAVRLLPAASAADSTAASELPGGPDGAVEPG